VDRRRFLLTSGACAMILPLAAEAQAADKVPRIGVVFSRSPLVTMLGPEPSNPGMRAFLQGLSELGYVEGQNILIERRALEGRLDRVPDVIAEMSRLNVEVLLAAGREVAVAARRVTTTLPIVVVDATYEGEHRLVESLARPGGNVTGLGVTQPYGPKQLQLLKEMVPSAARVAVPIEPRDSPGLGVMERSVEPLKAVASRLGVSLTWTEVKGVDAIQASLAAVIRQRPDALLVLGFPTLFATRRQIAAAALQHRIPTMCGYREFVDEGALMTYTDPLPEKLRRAASYVHRILRGAKPADLPIELPTKFELRINLKTAKALGLTIPPSLLLQADEVIE
jgi:putative ABC transport system substrate-binding protein